MAVNYQCDGCSASLATSSDIFIAIQNYEDVKADWASRAPLGSSSNAREVSEEGKQKSYNLCGACETYLTTHANPKSWPRDAK